MPNTEAALSTLHGMSNLPFISGIVWVTTFLSGENRMIKAKRKSFHTQTNCRTAIETIAGKAMGKTMRRKILRSEAPSTRADSSRSSGTLRKKFLKNNTAQGIPQAV